MNPAESGTTDASLFHRRKFKMSFFKHRKIVGLIVLGIFVHGLVLKAAFDIYFSSPIDHGMTPVKSTNFPPAKRVVLFVADGLRAEGIFHKEHTKRAPYLEAIRKTRGSWGISHTRVPTESRPGHVALLAGIYEDPSAILSGWQHNPVYFDSVINQSTNAWCWGSPDIVTPLCNQDKSPHIHTYTYDASYEDFGKKDTTVLDMWVFNKVEEFIRQQENCTTCKDFRKVGNVFFLHLLGLDTVGHGSKPNSIEYIRNIEVVDANIRRMEDLFEKAFKDKSTSYIFTSDHGMTNWGSHGAGSHHETRTPLIAWGAGIRKDNLQKDVRQIDVAVLISSLIGIHFPTNSQGKLPISYIAAPIENISEMLVGNVLQLLEIFNVKRLRTMANALRFVPFHGVTSQNLEKRMENIMNLKKNGSLESLKIECFDFMTFLAEGTDYYHNYYQLPILISITIGLVAWIINLGCYNVQATSFTRRGSKVIQFIDTLIFLPVYVVTIGVLYIQSLPVAHYLYFVFPIMMLQIVSRKYNSLLQALKSLSEFGWFNTGFLACTYLVGLRLLVNGFHARETCTYILMILSMYMFTFKEVRAVVTRSQRIFWTFGCFALSVFPFLPVMETGFNLYTHIGGYVLWWVALQNFLIARVQCQPEELRVLGAQHNFMKIVPILTMAVQIELIQPDSFLKKFSWFLAFYPILLIGVSSTRIMPRMTSIFLGFAPFYLMVTTNFETLFLCFYVMVLVIWLGAESKLFVSNTELLAVNYSDKYAKRGNITVGDYRRSFFFVLMVFVGFFGTGNVASLNSFDPMWVRCFLTIFSPFTMSALIILKIMVPMIFNIAVFRAINVLRRGDLLNIFSIVLMYSDIMLLQLLYCITNIGSWLEIGMSLSHFIIMEAFVLIMLVLYGLVYVITNMSYTLSVNGYLLY